MFTVELQEVGTYEELILVLEGAAESDGVNSDNMKVHEELLSKFDETLKDTLQSETITDIRRLKQTVEDIRKAFESVAFDLEAFAEKFEGIKLIVDLHPQWMELQDRFKQTMETSEKNATQAAVYLQVYCEVLLDKKYYENPVVLKEKLQTFTTQLEDKQEVALNAQRSFEDLARDVRKFAFMLKKKLKAFGAELPEAIDEMEDRLSALQGKLYDARRKMRHVGGACLGCLAVGAATVGLAIFTLSPDALCAAVTALIGSIRAVNEFWETKKLTATLKEDIEEYTQKLAVLRRKQDWLTEYQDAFLKTQNNISDLAAKIDVISGIWKSLKVDLIKLQEHLDLLLGDGNKDVAVGSEDASGNRTEMFFDRLRIAGELYKVLAICLTEYAGGTVAVRS